MNHFSHPITHQASFFVKCYNFLNIHFQQRNRNYVHSEQINVTFNGNAMFLMWDDCLINMFFQHENVKKVLKAYEKSILRVKNTSE